MKQIIIAVVVLLLTSSCSTYKKYSRPEEVSTNNLFGEDFDVTDTFTAASIPWHEFFTDSKLRTLIDTALANNSDLRIASLRVEQAEATLSAARLAYLPGISLNPQGGISSYAGDKAIKTYSLGLSADWEIDISGRITNEKRVTYANLRQQKDYRQAVSTQLVATVANSYYNLLALDQQLSISQKSLEAWNEIIRTLEVRKTVGEGQQASVAQAKASRLDVENTILSLSQQIKTQENSLCTLLGWTPRKIDRSDLKAQIFPDDIAIGVPLQLLENRPDIHQAESALQSAFYSTNVVRSAFYPSLTLGGTVGWTNNSGAAIINPGNWLLNAIGSLVQPLFNRGRNIANLKIAKAQQEEALIAFQQKLLEAGAEVNDALSQWQNAEQRLNVSARQIEALEDAVKSTRLLMTYSDSSSYLEVLTAQQSLLSAQLTETQETFDKIQGIIKLYHALGGG
jgi:outer membrane protein, multidrug efflux system